MRVRMITCYIGRMISLLILTKFVVHLDGRRTNIVVKPNLKKEKRHHKILRYFPLKSRLQRLFMSSKTYFLMRWHHETKANNGIMRYQLIQKHGKYLTNFINRLLLSLVMLDLDFLVMVFNHFDVLELHTSFGLWYLSLIIYHLGYV